MRQRKYRLRKVQTPNIAPLGSRIVGGYGPPRIRWRLCVL